MGIFSTIGGALGGGHKLPKGMKTDDIIFQVEKFIGWHRRAGGDLKANFERWAEGKDFMPEDEETIWVATTKTLALVEMAEPVACSMD